MISTMFSNMISQMMSTISSRNIAQSSVNAFKQFSKMVSSMTSKWFPEWCSLEITTGRCSTTFKLQTDSPQTNAWDLGKKVHRRMRSKRLWAQQTRALEPASSTCLMMLLQPVHGATAFVHVSFKAVFCFMNCNSVGFLPDSSVSEPGPFSSSNIDLIHWLRSSGGIFLLWRWPMPPDRFACFPAKYLVLGTVECSASLESWTSGSPNRIGQIRGEIKEAWNRKRGLGWCAGWVGL